jgi:hypothetical protein
MKKRIAAFVAAAIFSASAGIFATGLGPQTNFEPEFTPGYSSNSDIWGVSCSAKFDSVPVYWALSTNAGNYDYDDSDNSSVSNLLLSATLTGDYWVMNPTITGIWKWYWGFGGAVSTAVSMNGKNFYLRAGPRAVIGMNWHFCDGFLELYTQAAFQPELEFAFGEDGTNNGFVRVPIYFPFNTGLRFWF